VTNYQKQVESTAIYRDACDEIANFATHSRIAFLLKLSYVAMGLGEVGEIQGKIKKIIRDDLGKITPQREADLRKEVGDLEYYIHELANLFGWDMDEIRAENAAKLASRKERGVLGGSGDNR
jgi:hypothetical protein